MRTLPSLGALLAASTIVLAAGSAAAQEAAEGADDDAAPVTEEPDPTRLDVERLPPEAIQVTRDLYAHGFFVEAQLGAIGFLNGIGDIIDVGPWATISVGYEILDWLHVLVSGEGSMHNTSAPPPPAQTAFELLGGSASLRLQANFTEAFAMWLSGQFAVLVATTDILDIYGFSDASTIGIAYGGELGVDWHFRARHHSIGLLGGVRHYPSLEGISGGSPALGIHGSAYLRYVF
ncbi:MAG TPA: hypothetical protein RMH99_10200 [Sandaracinaceae bacterium LLY-WYZ-13_1]|nr:hypothetical protein [Sandaracinaceae bacterium LLY-WYZ-13_1]